MLKKVLLFAFAVSSAFSEAFAADPECVIKLSGATTFTGNQIKPTVTSVMCGDDEISDYKVAYGENINVGKESGSVTVTYGDDISIVKKFEIKKKIIYIKTENCEKEKGADDPEFSWNLVGSESIDLDVLLKTYKGDTLNYLADILKLNADTLSNLISVLTSNIKLKRVEGEEIANSSGDIIKYSITFADGVADKLNKLLPNYRVGLDDEYGYLIITKTKITVMAKDTSKVYGSADPKFETVITGNIKASEYKKLGTITLTRDKSSAADGNNVGTYEIVVSVPKDTTDDYIIETKSGKFTITPAKVSVKVDNVTKVYGSATPEFTYKATGLVGKDVLSDVTLSCDKCLATDLEDVGEYVVSANVKAASNPNYTVTVTDNGTLSVTPKAVTVTVNDAEKTYGDSDPKFTFEATGLVEGGATLKSDTITRAEGEKVGTYKVDVAFEDGANPNYKLTLKSGKLTVTQKAVTLTADNVTKLFGEADPELTYTVDGLVSFNGVKDTLAGVKLVREKGEDAGEYAITATVNAKSNPNYVVTIAEGGVLTIAPNDGKIVVTVKGHVDTVKYDGKEHLVGGYDILSNSTAYPLKFVEFTGKDTVQGKNAGSYAMGLSKENFVNTSVNYPNVEFEVADGSLTILPKSLVIKALPDTITYGDATPTEFKWTVDSLLKDDTLDNIHVGLAKTGLLPAGKYELVFDKKSPTTKNYVVSEFIVDTLVVNKKLVTVSVGDTSKVYGTPDPEEYQVSVSGLVTGDKLADYTVGREPGENVLRDSEGQDSSYKISVAFASAEGDPNYILKVKPGHFTITPYTEKITVSIIGDAVCQEYISNDSLITVPRSFDVLPLYFGENPLPDSLFYRKEFVSYTGVPTISGARKYLYPMNFLAENFVNISPNFTTIVFNVAKDGTLIIKDNCEVIPTGIAAVKAVAKFRLSSVGRNLQISGSTEGDRFAVLDMQGKVIRSGVVNSANFEVPVARAGIYMVRVGSVTQRIRVK